MQLEVGASKRLGEDRGDRVREQDTLDEAIELLRRCGLDALLDLGRDAADLETELLAQDLGSFLPLVLPLVLPRPSVLSTSSSSS